MQKFLIAIIILSLSAILYFKYYQENISFPHLNFSLPFSKSELQEKKLKLKSATLKNYIKTSNLSEEYCFLIDMSLHSGQKRFFIYNLENESIVDAGLVAHGSCNSSYLQNPKFSNTVNSGCSSIGKYRVGHSYNGQFGKAYKLFGLDSTNSNAFDRAVVLHAYTCVPDEEVYPEGLCNSLGCPMVSYQFLNKVSSILDHSNKPILLSIFN